MLAATVVAGATGQQWVVALGGMAAMCCPHAWPRGTAAVTAVAAAPVVGPLVAGAVTAALAAGTYVSVKSAGATREDPLTGLPDRRHLSRSVPAGAGAVFIDLDGFKSVNDQLGHDAGDRVLRAFSQRVQEEMRTRIRAGDKLVRWGGDEFVVLAEAVDEDSLARLAERLQRVGEEAIRKEVKESGGGAVAGATVGWAVAHRPMYTEQLLKAADSQMYKNKPSRKNPPRAVA